MKKKIVYIQPFQLIKKNLSNEPLIWYVYLDNFLKNKYDKLKSDVIYFPLEESLDLSDEKTISNESLNILHSTIDSCLSELNFRIDNNTIFCISGISFDFLSIKIISEYLQKYFPESIIIFGGYHATSCPDDFNYYNSPIDYIIIGEGEIALYNLIKNNAKKHNKPKIIEGTPIDDLNTLPSLDLSILDKYIGKFSRKSRGLSISLSRGCPHKCTYCIEDNLAKGKKVKRWRAYSPQRAIEETYTQINYGLENDIDTFGFFDPCFGHNKNWLDQYLSHYKPDDRIKTHFVETRLDVLNNKNIKKLKNCKMFQFYGVESFSKEMLMIMNKTHDPTNFLKKLNEIIEIHKKLDYKCSFGLITNHPGETKETIENSFTFLKKLAQNDKNNIFNYIPILYHLFAKTYNYENMSLLNKAYGTHIYFTKWWKEMESLRFGALTIKASSKLPLRESIDLFVENHTKINKIQLSKNKKDGLGLYLIKTDILKKQKNEFLNFLNERNIEIETSEIY